MIDQLKELFIKELAYAHTSGLLNQISNILTVVGSQYMKDNDDAKNTAIDLICSILQSHKDTPAPIATPESVITPINENSELQFDRGQYA